MNQLRLDPLSGRWVVISTTRSQRPVSFVERTHEEAPGPCPFCPGSKETTKPTFESKDPQGNWSVRIVPNLYPAFFGDDPFVVTNRGPVFTQASAGGIHEVLVLSPSHDDSWAKVLNDQSALIMGALRTRIEEHSKVPHLRYTQAIVNSGREAGASMAHPHGQLLGMSFVPRELAEEQARFARFVGACLLCTTIDAEGAEGHRVIHESDDVMVICPFWSSTPYEMLIIPKHHSARIYESLESEVESVGQALKAGLTQLKDVIGTVAYNVVFHSSPYRSTETFHWHVHVWPKATTVAGFEMGTGVAVNVVNPEQAADQLRVSVSTL